SELPDLTAPMRHPLRTSEEAWRRNFCGLLILSVYRILMRELCAASNDSSKYSSASSTPIWAELPTDHTLLYFSTLRIPLSTMNMAVAPEPEMKSTPLGSSCGTGEVNDPL